MSFLYILFFAFPSWSIDLDQAVQSTLQKNESVGQSQLQLQQVSEQQNQAKSLIYPSVKLNGTYFVQPPVNDPVAKDFFPEKQSTVNLNLTQPLFRGFRELATVRRQKNLYSAQEQIHFKNRIQLYQEVAQSYMQVLALSQDLRNVEAQKTIYQGRIKDLQARTRRGESSSTETLTAQSTAAALDAEFQILNANLRMARENFSYLTGLGLDVELSDIEDAQQIVQLKTLEDYLGRIDERPDIKTAKEQLQASEEDISIAKGGHWPTADLVGNYYLVRPDGYLKDSKWDAQLQVSIPIFEGGLRQSQVREAAMKRGASELEVHRLRRQSTAEIKSLYESVRLRVDQLKALERSSDLAEKNYQVLLRDSKKGLSRSIDVQLGLTEYRVAKRAYDQARYQAKLERIRLDLAAAILPEVLKKDI